MNRFPWDRKVLKPVLFIVALVPAVLLAWGAYAGTLSANPIKDITEETGIWTLRFLLITLAVTPLRLISGWSRVAGFRRMLGLFALFYGSLHFTTYVYLDQFFAFDEILRDVVKRPFILVGFSAFLMMFALAATSPHRVAKWMGGRWWRRIHRLVYLVAIGGVIHYLWLVKADTSRPLRYGAVLAVLLLYRIGHYLWMRRKFQKPVAAPGPTAA